MNFETIKKFTSSAIVEESPFPHIIYNSFLPYEIIQQAESEFIKFTDLENSGGYRYGNLKRHFSNFEKMPETIKSIISLCYSDQFISFLEKKFKISNIVPDWSLWGGGMHSSPRGGNLKIHSDFIFLRKKNTRRVLNLLLYLNSNWKDEWKGHIELWDKNMSKKEKQLSPNINNLLIFRTDKDSNHGFPESILCPDGITRKSIALYYYVEESYILPIKVKMRKYYTTQWKHRPGTDDPQFMDEERSLWRKIKYKYLPSFIIRKK